MFKLNLRFIFLFIFSGHLSFAHDVGELFLVDHYRANSSESPALNQYKEWIVDKKLGGLVFWNGGKDNYITFRKMLKQYADTAAKNGLNPPIMTTDYEGRTVQRFMSKHGFTELLSPSQLGQYVKQTGQTDLCYLHGAILSKELSSVGFNSALSTVADVLRMNRGTKKLLIKRAISDNPNIVARCVLEIYNGAYEHSQFLFYTKHFPGLGSVNGNTDTDTRRSTAKAPEEESENILPYLNLVDNLSQQSNSSKELLLGLMVSSSYYPFYDKAFPAVESKNILQGILRDNMKFKGLVTSDALWVGKYDKLPDEDYFVAISQMIIAGTDQLMIASGAFLKSYNFFKSFYNGVVNDQVAARLLKDNNLANVQMLKQIFKTRVDQSVERVRLTKKLLAQKRSQSIESESPLVISASLRIQYYELAESVNIRLDIK